MVRQSYRQRELNQAKQFINGVIQQNSLVKIAQLEVGTYNYLGNDQDEIFTAVLEELLSMLNRLHAQRVFARRRQIPKRSKMIHWVDYWALHNPQRFRGLVRMVPSAFEDMALQLATTKAFADCSLSSLREKLAVAMYRLGRSGNAAGFRDVAYACSCSEGSVYNWTSNVVDGLNELSDSVLLWASEEERVAAKQWVLDKSGVDKWSQGWAVLDGTKIPLAFKPGINSQEWFDFKSKYSASAQFVMLPHSLRIIECVVGFPGSAHDQRVWASGSLVVKEPRLYLDEGEFIWTDSAYGHSAFTVATYSWEHSLNKKDLRSFNYKHSTIRSRAEHGIAYFKQRFQSMMGYRANVYRRKDEEAISCVIRACVVAHTIASKHDRPQDVSKWLAQGNLTEDAEDHYHYMNARRSKHMNRIAQHRRRESQRIYAQQQQEQAATLSIRRQDAIRSAAAHDLREEMHTALFENMGWEFVDTTKAFRYKER